jgi:murein DD-endopeptidase MepM/ murein hydrolase activator NlpD
MNERGSQMTKKISGQRLGLAILAIALGTLLITSNQASSQDIDYSNETYKVDFMPWANRKLAFRTTDGQWIGYSNGGVKLEMLIDGNTYRQAVTPDGIDVVKLLSQMSPQTGSDGSTYFTMKIMQDTQLDDGRILPASTDSAPTEVLLDVNDFYVSKTLQPVDSNTGVDGAPAPQIQARDRFNDKLRYDGVTPADRPADIASDYQVAPDQTDDVDDEGNETTPSGYIVDMGRGNPFPQRILSSPVCSCRGSSCGISSNFGSRGRMSKERKCINFKTRNGQHGSCNHQGMDIHTSAHQVGTPVVAAADGCFKVKKGRAPRPQGERISLKDLREGGYGTTIRLTHGNDIETQYSHLKSVSPKVRWGMCVKRGEVIGTMGQSGNATGPHLHFGVAVGRRNVDPRRYLLGSNGQGKLDGTFFDQTCSDLPRYDDLDREMSEDLHRGRRTRETPMRRSRTVN